MLELSTRWNALPSQDGRPAGSGISSSRTTLKNLTEESFSIHRFGDGSGVGRLSPATVPALICPFIVIDFRSIIGSVLPLSFSDLRKAEEKRNEIGSGRGSWRQTGG